VRLINKKSLSPLSTKIALMCTTVVRLMLTANLHVVPQKVYDVYQSLKRISIHASSGVI